MRERIIFSRMDTTTDTNDEVLEGPTRGQAAFNAIQPMLATLGEKELMVINVDLSAAAIGAIGVAERAREPMLLTRLRRLPLDEFDFAQVELLVTLGWATLHLATRYNQPRGRKLPSKLVEQGIAVKTRMQICCEYHLGDIPEARTVLDRLRPGNGYRDLAGDLLGYAELYRTYRDVLSRDLKYYQATDEADAVQTAEQIFTHLGESATAEPEVTSLDARRLWTLLVSTYEDVAATGRWLLRREPARAERLFPSLFSLSRTTRRSRSGEPETGDDPIAEPVVQS
jgi:hypothetical protein